MAARGEFSRGPCGRRGRGAAYIWRMSRCPARPGRAARGGRRQQRQQRRQKRPRRRAGPATDRLAGRGGGAGGTGRLVSGGEGEGPARRYCSSCAAPVRGGSQVRDRPPTRGAPPPPGGSMGGGGGEWGPPGAKAALPRAALPPSPAASLFAGRRFLRGGGARFASGKPCSPRDCPSAFQGRASRLGEWSGGGCSRKDVQDGQALPLQAGLPALDRGTTGDFGGGARRGGASAGCNTVEFILHLLQGS